MSKNKAFRSTVSYLIVRDMAHEKVLAKVLEALGVNWGNVLPVPKIDTSKMLEVRELERRNLHNQQWKFASDNSEMAQIFKGGSPFGDGELETLDGAPDGFEIPQMPERPEEFSPGLDAILKEQAKSLSGKTMKSKTRPKESAAS